MSTPAAGARRRLLVVAAVGLAAFGAVAGRLLSPVVRLGVGAGEWREVTAGIRWSPGSPTMTGQRQVLVHFHDLTVEPTEVVLVVAARGPADLLHLWVGRDGETIFRVSTSLEPAPLTVPVRPGADSIDITVSAEPAVPGARTAYRIHEIVLRRQGNARRRLAQTLPIVVGLAVLVVGWRRNAPWSALAWAVLATAGTLGALVALVDPNAALRLLPATRTALWWAGLVVPWVLALSRPGRLAGLAAVFGTVAGLYLDTVHHGFVNEDFNFARRWSGADLLATLHGSWDPKGGVATYFRPVVSWSFALDHALWGARPEGYHITNLLIHALSGALAATLLARLGLTRRAALAGALAWMAHPLAATAAAWTNQRTDGLAALFSLAALVAAVHPTPLVPRVPAVLFFAALALGSKEMAATLPLTAGLCVWVAYGQRGLTNRRNVLAALLGVVALYAAFWAALFPEKLLRLGTSHRWEGFEGLDGAGGWARVPAVFFALVFAPVVDYERWRATAIADLSPPYLAAGALVAPLSWAILRHAGETRGAHVALLGVVWPLVTVVPLLAIAEVDLFRLGFLVCFAFPLVWGGLLTYVDRRAAPLAVALAVAVLAVLVAPARRTAAVWGPQGSMKAELPLWRRHVGERWWSSLTPEMQRRFEDEVARLSHQQRLMEH